MIRGGLVVLNVADVGRSVRFYIETLGMKLVEEIESGSAVIDAGEGFQIELAHTGGSAPAGAAPTRIRLYPKIDIREAIAIYENRGIAFTTDETARAIVATFHDPDGNVLCLVQNLS
jgi:catechol 2,3-dioxygenase-like lactoylglutathione lyase family enzyme